MEQREQVVTPSFIIGSMSPQAPFMYRTKEVAKVVELKISFLFMCMYINNSFLYTSILLSYIAKTLGLNISGWIYII